MSQLTVHHISIAVTNLQRSIAFYQDMFNLERIERPPLKTKGAWFDCGGFQIHLIENEAGSFRTKPGIDTADSHFAFRIHDFESFVGGLIAKGFRENADQTDPKLLYINRKALAGFPQAYLLDPDLNIIEVNAASL